jgi:hypothetical protein
MIEERKWDGKPISEPGMYFDVPIDRYHEVVDGKYVPLCVGTSISSTGLRVLASKEGGPKYFFSEWAGNPARKERKEKEHFVFGHATHFLFLGQSFFSKEFIIRPDEIEDPKTGEMKPWHGNRTVCKEWLADAAAAKRSVLSGEMVENIKGASVEISKHALAPQFLRGKTERTLVWRDKETGIWVKARPDSIPTDDLDICDLKSTISVQRRDLVRTLDDYAYHQQAALVRTACREVLGLEMSTFTLLFFEKTNPWAVRDVRLKDSDLDRGERQNRAALQMFWRCLRTKEWPGPGAGAEGTEYIELSQRSQERIDEQLKEMENPK